MLSIKVSELVDSMHRRCPERSCEDIRKDVINNIDGYFGTATVKIVRDSVASESERTARLSAASVCALMSSPRLNFYFWDNDCSVIYSRSSEDRQHCYRFDNAIPCWLFRGNAELCIKQWEDIKASGKCIVELTYNGGATWYRCSNPDVCEVFDSYEAARIGIAKNLERFPNDTMPRRIRRA